MMMMMMMITNHYLHSVCDRLSSYQHAGHNTASAGAIDDGRLTSGQVIPSE